MSAFDLSGRLALVTGANTGLGQGIALALAQAGADIVGVGRSAPTETETQVTGLGRRFAWIQAALDATAPIADIMRSATECLGQIDILVNNAGAIRRNDALDFSEEDWDAVIGVNLKTVFFLSQAVGRAWVAAGRGAQRGHPGAHPRRPLG